MDQDEDQDDARGRVIVSPSLVYSRKLDATWPMPKEFDKIFMHLFEDHSDGKSSGKPFSDNDDDDSMDELLLLASQAYESRYAYDYKETTNDDTKAGSRKARSEGVNMLTLQPEEYPIHDPIGVSNRSSSHSSAVPKAVSVKETSSSFSVSQVKNCTEFASDTSSANTTRFASPKSSRYVDEIRKSAIPKKTRQNTEWAERTWHSWAKHRMEKMSPEELEKGYELDTKFASMNVAAMNFWLRKFILEVRNLNGKEYSPDSFYQICCGLHRSLKDNNRRENIFDDAEFAEFRGVLDGQLKGLNRTGSM